jgi:hypothetical protein
MSRMGGMYPLNVPSGDALAPKKHDRATPEQLAILRGQSDLQFEISIFRARPFFHHLPPI